VSTNLGSSDAEAGKRGRRANAAAPHDRASAVLRLPLTRSRRDGGVQPRNELPVAPERGPHFHFQSSVSLCGHLCAWILRIVCIFLDIFLDELLQIPKFYENVRKCYKFYENLTNSTKMLENISKFHKFYKNVRKRFKFK